MDVAEHRLFPTRLITIQFPDTESLNCELCNLLDQGREFPEGFSMHPDSMNLLRLADRVPAIARLREMFLDGLQQWLKSEESQPHEVDLVMFSNYAAEGEMTLAHNHNADLVGVYYARTRNHDRPALQMPDGNDDYFEVGDGALVLHDPRFNANLAALSERDYVRILPREGLMAIFPAYVWHTVTPHQGEFRRLSFSMNFTLRWDKVSKAVRHKLSSD